MNFSQEMVPQSRLLANLSLLTLVVGSVVLNDSAEARPINALVANRGDGSFSVIDVTTKAVTTHLLPNPGILPEPMYITYSPGNDLVYIGDRANERLVVYDANDYSTHLGFVPVGAGIFHQWGDPIQHQLWVNNDIDDTISVVSMLTSSVITTIPIPADLVSGKPHDVILDPNANSAFVTILGVTGVDDYVSSSVITGVNPYGIEIVIPEPGSATLLFIGVLLFATTA